MTNSSKVTGFKCNWLNRTKAYSKRYIRRSKVKCESICYDNLECFDLKITYDIYGYLKCQCLFTGEEKIFQNICWTPKTCIRAKPNQSVVKIFHTYFLT